MIWSGTEIAATIIASSIPVLRKFFTEKVNSVVEAYGTRYGLSASGGSGSGSNGQSKGSTTKGSSVVMSRLSKNSKGNTSRGTTWLDSTENREEDSESRRSILGENGIIREASPKDFTRTTTTDFPGA